MPSFDREKSRAVLIGSGVFDDSAFATLRPASRNGLWEIGQRIRDANLIGIEDVILIEDRKHSEVIEQLREECSGMNAAGLLLVYFVGHGVTLANGNGDHELFLVTRNTSTDHITDSAIPYSVIRDCIDKSGSGYSLELIDCCYSAAANPSLEKGRSILAACSAKNQAILPPKSKLTGFTSAVVHVLDSGSSDEHEVSFASFFGGVKKRCHDTKLPEPADSLQSDAAAIYLAANRAANNTSLLAKLEPQISRYRRQARDNDDIRSVDDYVCNELFQLPANGGHRPRALEPIFEFGQYVEYHRKLLETQQCDLLEWRNDIIIDDENGDTRVVNRSLYRFGEPIRSLWRLIYGSGPLRGVNLLELKFNSKPSVQDYRTALLVDRDDRKEVVFFFNPPLPNREEVQCMFEWRWPRMFKPLFKEKRDTWSFRLVSSTAEVGHVSNTFWLPKKILDPLRIYVDNRLQELTEGESHPLIEPYVMDKVGHCWSRSSAMNSTRFELTLLLGTEAEDFAMLPPQNVDKP